MKKDTKKEVALDLNEDIAYDMNDGSNKEHSSLTKKRKREANLKVWKWDEVIDVDDFDDDKDDFDWKKFLDDFDLGENDQHDSLIKKRKREANLKIWDSNKVIVVDDFDDEKDDFGMEKLLDDVKLGEDDTPLAHLQESDDDDISNQDVKLKKMNQVKLKSKNRMRLLDED